MRLFLLLFLVSASASAQYNLSAGQSAPRKVEEKEVEGKKTWVQTDDAPERDVHANANGTQYDLAVDGAFEGQTVVLVQAYQFDTTILRGALKEKGFNLVVYPRGPPSPDEFGKALEKACQLWWAGGDHATVQKGHLAHIKRFFNAGHGVYLWGDNQPLYVDTNIIGEALVGAKMLGDVPGDQIIGLRHKKSTNGVLPNHLITTGVEQMYEGVTIATVQPHKELTPLVYGSAGNLVAAAYEKDGKRLIIDGGFTRLYYKWGTAGTARYVKNAAAWLVNAERFKDKVANVGAKRAQ